jgi:hypothetical protein
MDLNEAAALVTPLQTVWRQLFAGELSLVAEPADTSSIIAAPIHDRGQEFGAMFLAQVGPQVKIALELTRLSQVFRVFNDVDSALAELAN